MKRRNGSSPARLFVDAVGATPANMTGGHTRTEVSHKESRPGTAIAQTAAAGFAPVAELRVRRCKPGTHGDAPYEEQQH
jgi:hypothetical protein